MLRKLREKSKNKKGFTMVELIVVIVIILVLAGALVPSLMKYMDSAKEANCKADAATVLAQLQADYVASLATEETGVTVDPVTYEVSGVPVVKNGTLATADAKNAVYVVDAATDEITKFQYYDGEKYIATWENTVGWTMTP